MDLCITAGSAGTGGAAIDPGECVSRGAAAWCGVGGGAAGVGEPVGYEAGDGGLGGEEVGEEMREPAVRWSRCWTKYSGRG